MVIAIDGPAGSGKSTSAKLVAQKLGFLYIDTGAMYRAVTLLALRNNLINDSQAVVQMASEMDLRLKFDDGQTRVFVGDEEVTKEIRSQLVNSFVSEISKIEGVRSALVAKQREMGNSENGIVMEGRDIGTVVFPSADVKIFMTCSIDERAERRAKEFDDSGNPVSVEEIKNNLIKRDKIDSGRDASPLIKAQDAVEIDTSDLTIDQQVNMIIEQAKKIAAKKGINLNILNKSLK
ncbi:MAG: (d)CMP kinase [Ignavibacteriaceae bacterium]